MTPSINAFVGRAWLFHLSWSQLPLRIQAPFGSPAACSADAIGEFGLVLRVAQVDGEEAEAPVEEMDVRVVEPRRDQAALEVDDAGVLRRESTHRRVVPHRQHLVARDRESGLESALAARTRARSRRSYRRIAGSWRLPG